MKKKRWLSILLSLSLLLTLVPTQAFAEEGPEGTESACTQTADCPAQVHEPDCPLWREDSTVPEETGTDETGPDETGPDETGPDESNPGETVPEETGTDETSPEEPEAPSEPEETVPGETVPDETVPGETGPDETVPGETAPGETAPDETGETTPDEPAEPGEPEETQPTALEQLLALAESLPDEVTGDNADEVTAQLQAFTRLYAGLTEDEQETDEVYAALARVLALQSALDALTGEDNTPALLDTAENVAYVYATYNEETNTVTYNEADANATVVDENTTEWVWGTAGETTWYVVQGTVETSIRITVTGEVRLILANNCHLNAQAGIQVVEGNSLTIYAQTANGEVIDGTTGQLTATAAAETNNAGIGGNGSTDDNNGESSGPITIYGGIVTATGTTSGMSGSAGIGGGGGSTAGKGEAITIYGGTVAATGGRRAAGIGGGGTNQSTAAYAGSGSKITIHGGVVNATGVNYGAGIGGGYYGEGSNITITGGEVTATGGDYAAGIGGGGRGAGSGITITGGTVKASSGTVASNTQGAGIGGGYYGAGSNITISGGTVEATSHNKGAGIGGGSNGAGSNITISGGTVTAISKKYGAGIGGGNESASGANSITISGGTVTATSEVGGAGIGGGINSSSTNTVSITGGFVVAQGGAVDSRIGAGAAIGSGGGFGSNPSSGTETTFTTDDTNAVVLTKPGTADSTMTGTVYGSYTLAEDVTLSNDTALTIPDGASLTVAASLTMTNDGTITIDQGGAVTIEATGTLTNNGIITNNGTITNNGAIINNGTINGNGTITGNQPGVEVKYQAYDTEKGEFSEATAIATPVTSDMTALGTDDTETWYVVNSAAANDLTITNRITVKSNVHLILADGAKLTASAGINVPEGSGLTIYGQTAGTGKLIATGGTNQAGIGGNQGSRQSTAGNCGPITINGGTVTATGGNFGAGIGGGYYGTGTVTINGGVVTATGGSCGAGIGGGEYGAGTVAIHGGTVNATSTSNGAGIGGGDSRPGYVTITGGTVTATGGMRGAGIGGGYGENASPSTTVTISGGTVTAKGGGGGAGIGTGSWSSLTATITISGGFVTATGGAEYKSGNYTFSAGAAIGSGGDISDTTGTEADESNFNNAVVLRQSGAAGSTMTGQSYGDPTLTTDAEVPAGASLLIPEGTSLTVGANTTLTNSGAIYQEGGSLLYGDPNYGTLNNGTDGTIYYLLTIEGGSATATEGMATYNDKTYAEEKATVTLTAEDQVGLAFNGEWTASPTSANVTFTKVEGTAETAETYQFTMPAQVLTVTAGYENAPTYTVTIPASVSIGNTASTAAIEATGVNVAEGWSLNVTLTATSGENDAFTLALSGHPDVTLTYTMTLTKTTVKLGEDAQETTDTPNTTVNVKDTVLTIPGGTANSSGSAELTFAMVSGQLKQYSGSYTGTVTFTVSVTEDEAPDDSDNPGDNPGGDNPGGSDTTTDTTGDSDNTSGDSGSTTADTTTDTGENP